MLVTQITCQFKNQPIEPDNRIHNVPHPVQKDAWNGPTKRSRTELPDGLPVLH